MISRLHRAVGRLAALLCRHPAGVMCPHRQWEYDRWYRGYNDGFAAATRHAQEKLDPFYPWPVLDPEWDKR